MGSYPVLSLADLHYRFGHLEDALQAIHETIRIAHQSNEHESLALAIAYLYRIVSVQRAFLAHGSGLL